MIMYNRENVNTKKLLQLFTLDYIIILPMFQIFENYQYLICFLILLCEHC